ncbi:50S ribosomal protein L5 [Candidatus Daviesbacteria bacterium]|nr:50S ribosomal protein L5 [Candidatus Daviesbacteria bacterium]
MNRLREKFNKDIKGDLAKTLGLPNVFAVPKVVKVVLNIGVGEATVKKELVDHAAEQLTAITGQKASIRHAKKSVASFKLREGQPIGTMVTLRGDRAYAFLDKLFNIVLPRLRDFRGLAMSGFDGRGNFSLGLREQTVFPEIEYAKIDKIRGLEITIVTTASNDQQAKELLLKLGMPFKKDQNG